MTISCAVSTSDPVTPLGLEIWVDHQKLIDQDHVQNPVLFSHVMPDVDGQHQLRIVLKNKQANDTKLDEQGKIVKDACLIVDNLTIADVPLGYLMSMLSTYTHDYNGTGPKTQDKFYNIIGCNGVVELKFTTPVYLWLLENL